MDSMLSDRNALGLRCVTIPRLHNGFGFTLRHFIVYPPELYANETDYCEGTPGDRQQQHYPFLEQQRRLGKVTEPVDTIFVKSVRENGPAAQAGLCVGDRIVSVNGETIVGKSYDQVVHLIQKSKQRLSLEVSPKQYDTLQLFYEEKAYRPETNQRPFGPLPSETGANHITSVHLGPNQNYSLHSQNYNCPFSNNYTHQSQGQPLQQSSNSSYESIVLYGGGGNQNMASTYPNSSQAQQFISHLPRPTPYKSSGGNWSHINPVQQQPQQQQQQHAQSHQQPKHLIKPQPQSYYPFNQDSQSPHSQPLSFSGGTPLRKIREEPNPGAKSAESVLGAGRDGGSSSSFACANRSESMECLSAPGASGTSSGNGAINWKTVGPGYRYSISTGPGTGGLDSSGFRRDSTVSLPSTSYQNNMIVTMSSTNNYEDIESSGRVVGPNNLNNNSTNSSINSSPLKGYETKMQDRIRRSCEQKEEFLRRPNQPMQWAPLQKPIAAGFPKELYAQPQKFSKVPWPPANILPTVSSTNQPQSVSGSPFPEDSNTMVVSMHQNSSSKTPKVTSKSHNVGRRNNGSKSLTQSPSVDQQMTKSTSSYYGTSSNKNFSHHQQPVGSSGGDQARSVSPNWYLSDYGTPKNRLTVVGSGKLHCDPPPDWKPDLTTLTYYPENLHYYESQQVPSTSNASVTHETDLVVQNRNEPMYTPDVLVTVNQNDNTNNYTPKVLRPNYLALPADFQHQHQHLSSYAKNKPLYNSYYAERPLDTDHVILRKRESDPDYDNDRLVRRVSYLKATSSPIDMESERRTSTSPTSPSKSCDNILVQKSVPPAVGPGRRRSVANKLYTEFVPKGRIVRLKQFFEDRTQPASSLFRFYVDSPTTEFRHFGSFHPDKSPDTTDVTREGQVYFKIRVGESKRGGYNRSWRQGWAQVRRSGGLYLSKERLPKDSISGTEDSVIVYIGLRDGISIEQADDYTKRKNVFRIKTTFTPEDFQNFSPPSNLNANTNTTSTTASSSQQTSGVTVSIGGSSNVQQQPNINSNQQQFQPVSVEILIQAEDHNDLLKWLQCLLTQQENNNYLQTGNKGIMFGLEFLPKQKSLLTSLLPSQGPHGQSERASPTVTMLTSNAAVTSPKSRTWKGKVARGWKKAHNIIHTNSSGSDPSKASPSLYNPPPPKGTTFGVHLEDCPRGIQNRALPRVIEYSIEVVESRGINIVGLYRIPGNNASVACLTEILNRGEDPNPEKEPKWLDVHVVASLIKSFLRRLPDPLLTDDRYPDFIKAADEEDPSKSLEKISELIKDLPDCNYETLRAIVLHLKNVAEHASVNKMEARNLAIVFGPTIVRTGDESVIGMVADMKNQCKIVEMLILNAEGLFQERRVRPETPSIAQSIAAEEAHSQGVVTSSSNTAPLSTGPAEIKNSILKAAMRKAKQSSSNTPAHDIYGLPSKPFERPRPVDESGLIRSYAGLSEVTEQRVRNFELETRAMMSREERSPNSSLIGLPTTTLLSKSKGIEDIRLQKLRLDDALKKAKDDLDNDDIYDQLADNPSSEFYLRNCIVQHRERGLPSYMPVTHNLSSSSVSSSNSTGNPPVPSSVYPTSTWPTPTRLGPTPFKSPFASQNPSLPPKPPNVSTTPLNMKLADLSKSVPPSVCSPIRRVNSVDRLRASTDETNPNTMSTFDSSKVAARGTLKRNKKIDTTGPVPFNPKYYGGSLDSLKDLANGNDSGSGYSVTGNITACPIVGVRNSFEDLSPRSSDGSDLVTSLSKTLDKKLETLRRPEIKSKSFDESRVDTEEDCGEEDEVFPEENSDEEIQKTKPRRASVSQISDCLSQSTDAQSSREVTESMKPNGLFSLQIFPSKNQRRNSMIDRRKLELEYEAENKLLDDKVLVSQEDNLYRDPSLHRLHIGENSWAEAATTNGVNVDSSTNLTKEAKTVTNRLTKECRRRHSLSGTADIFRFVFQDPDRGTEALSSNSAKHSKTLSSETLATALSNANILESHV